MTPATTTISSPATGVVPAFIYARHRGDTNAPATPETVLSEKKLEPAHPTPSPAAPDSAEELNLYRDPAPALTPDTSPSPTTRSHDNTAPIEPIKHADFHAPAPSAVLPASAPAIPNEVALLAPGLAATWHYTHHKPAPEQSV